MAILMKMKYTGVGAIRPFVSQFVPHHRELLELDCIPSLIKGLLCR